jgi:thiol-disulfide isomerase/thioredoxin
MSKWKGWRWVTGFFLLATAWGVVGVRSLHSPEATEVIVPHGPQGEAPSLRVIDNQVTYGLPLLNGAWRSSLDDQGLAVVICFWAPWCDPCQSLMSWLVAYRQTLSGKPVTVLAVGVETDAQSVQASGLQLPVALLPKNPQTEAAWVNRLPLIWLVSPEGRLLWQGEGYGSRLRLERELARCLQTPSGQKQTGTHP